MSGGSGSSGSGLLNSSYLNEGNLAQNFGADFSPTPYPGTGQAATSAYNDLYGGGAFPWQTSAGAWTPGYQGNQGATALGAGGNLLGQATGTAYSEPMTAGQNTYNSLSPYIGQALRQGFDPQKQLYNKLFQQQQEQNLASQAMQGVSTTPYGSGLTTQGNQNFDIAWQQAQLANQAQGAQTAEGLAGAGTSALNSGYSTGVGNETSLTNAAGNLFNTGASLGTNAATFGNNLNQQQISDLLSYLGASSGNSLNLVNAISALTGAASGQTSALGNANYQNNALLSSELGGLGSLGGTLGGLGLGAYLAGRQ